MKFIRFNWKITPNRAVRLHRRVRQILLIVISAIAVIATWRSVSLLLAARQPIDAWFILGGSIKREMYIAEQAATQRPAAPNTLGKPDIPILISAGSKLPCIWAIFNRAGANLDRVWVEECATSTFSNFVYSIPILADWKARHVKLTTSETHYPRAKWMAQIAFGLRGIWVEFDPAPEIGIPANQESRRKTVLDVTRTVLTSAVTSIIAPIASMPCDRLTNLGQVDWSAWTQAHGSNVTCEYQAQILPEELPSGITIRK